MRKQTCAAALAATIALLVVASSASAQLTDADKQWLQERFCSQAECDTLKARVAELERKYAELEAKAGVNSDDVRDLREEFTTVVRDDLLPIVRSISRPEGNSWVPTVNQSLLAQPFATVKITNRMQSTQAVLVNNQLMYIPPGTIHPVTVKVRAGDVTTEIPGFEQQKVWHVGPSNNFEIAINIVPRVY